MNKIILSVIFLIITCTGCELNYDWKSISNDSIKGTWNYNNDIDSALLIISYSTMKEYIYERKTGKLIERTDYGTYSLFRISSPKGKYEDRQYISLKDYNDQEDPNSGDAYWSKFMMIKNDTELYIPRKNTSYKKIK